MQFLFVDLLCMCPLVQVLMNEHLTFFFFGFKHLNFHKTKLVYLFYPLHLHCFHFELWNQKKKKKQMIVD